MTDNTPREGALGQPDNGPEDRSGPGDPVGRQPPGYRPGPVPGPDQPPAPPPEYGPPQAPPPGYGQPQAPAPGYGQPPGTPPGYGQQPGYGPPAYGPPGYGPPPGYSAPPGYGPGAGYGPGGWSGAGAPQPGGIPLRPLGLGDIWSGAVTVIRRNPVATVGLAAIVLAIVGVGTTVLTIADSRAGHTGSVGPVTPLVLLLDLIGELILTGLITMVIGRGVLGQRVSIGQAWSLARSRLWALLGVTALTILIDIGLWIPWTVVLIVLVAAHLDVAAVVWGILGALATLAVTALVAVRLSLAVPATVLERCGPAASLRRSWGLTRGSFWRILGILLLTAIVVGLASLILRIPFLLVSLIFGGFSLGTGGAGGAGASAGSTIVGGIGAVIAGAIVVPIISGVVVLLYLDMRMRKEGLDLALSNAVRNGQLGADQFAALWQPPAPGAPGSRGAMAGPPPASW